MSQISNHHTACEWAANLVHSDDLNLELHRHRTKLESDGFVFEQILQRWKQFTSADHTLRGIYFLITGQPFPRGGYTWG